MRYSDKPINRPADDLLGRSGFARILARAIDQLQASGDGFVIGLIGEWGSGKSSVIELVARFLRHEEMLRAEQVGEPPSLQRLDEMSDLFTLAEDKIKLLEERNLNPSMWESGHRDREFRRWFNSDEDAETAFRYWRLKLAIEARPSNIVVRFSPWLIAGRAELASALLSDIARAAGEQLGDDVRQAFAGLVQRLSEFAAIAGPGIDALSGGSLGGLFTASADMTNSLAKKMTTGPTLDAVRERLRASLGRLQGQRLVVIIDDLDRLTPAEATEMVSLVKSLGDLPNVVYILSFDEARLSSLIGSYLEVDGSDYLSKIVQYPVHLPPLEHTQIMSLLSSDLARLIPPDKTIDPDRIGNAWNSSLRYYVRTPRDARRLANSYSMAMSGLADYTDWVDLLLIEALRLFDPDVYMRMRLQIRDLVG